MITLKNNEICFRCRIELTTLSDVKEFVSIASACPCNVMLVSGDNFAINAKSLLGVIVAKKLNWDSLTVVADKDCYEAFRKFIIEE